MERERSGREVSVPTLPALSPSPRCATPATGTRGQLLTPGQNPLLVRAAEGKPEGFQPGLFLCGAQQHPHRQQGLRSEGAAAARERRVKHSETEENTV